MSGRAAVSRRLALAVLASLCAVPAVLASADTSAFALSPTFVGSFGFLERPTGMAVEESTGNVLVPEQGEDLDVVKVFGEKGGLPAGGAPDAFSGEGTPDGSFAFNFQWVGVAVDNSTSSAAGSVYVVDRGHKVVDRFKLSGGEFKYESQLTGTEPGGVATDAHGNVYVSDQGAKVIREYSPAGGTEIASFAAEGLQRSASIDTKGDIFVYGNPEHTFPSARPAEIRRSSDTATSVEEVIEVPEVEGANADTIDRATNRGYVAIHGRVIENVASPSPARTGVEFGAGIFSEQLESIAVNEQTGAIYVADAGAGLGEKKIFIYQGAPSHFPLTVSIEGEGEVTSTPAGLTCSTGVCTHEFEGEPTLTAKAGAGYEFAGWIGCAPISATTCTVDRSVSTNVTAVFLKAGKEAPVGAPGPAGQKGATGATGARGRTGARGPAGPAGKIELVTCRKVRGRQRCTARLVSGTIRFTIAGHSARATLSRHGVVYAAGVARLVHGHTSLRLSVVHRLRAGRYMLTLIRGSGRHRRISSELFILR
jgi:hypothetical protein